MRWIVVVGASVLCSDRLHGNKIRSQGCAALSAALEHVPQLTSLEYVQLLGWACVGWLRKRSVELEHVCVRDVVLV